MTAIQDVARELALNVHDQVRVWQRLLELSQAQRAALEAQDVHMVHAVLQEVEVVMLERSRAEVRRGVLVAQGAAMLGVPAEELTRDMVAACCEPELAQQLATASEQLRALVVELDSVVARNKVLLEQELQIIEVLVQGATVDTSSRATYGKLGTQQDAPRLRLLDAQV